MALDALSDREREVLDMALSGLTAREIAKRLTLTEATIRSHLGRVYAKLGVSGRVELMARRDIPRRAAATPVPALVANDSELAAPVQPARRRPSRRAVVTLGLVGLVVAAGALVLGLRSGPTATTVDQVSQWLAQGKVTSVELRGETTLFVTTADRGDYRVDNTDQAAWQRLWQEWQQLRTDTTFSQTKSSDDPWFISAVVVASVAPSVLVVLLLVALALATLRWVIRSTPPSRHA